MDRFDDWFADRRLTRTTIGPHLNDPGRLGTGGARRDIAHDADHQSCKPRAAIDPLRHRRSRDLAYRAMFLWERLAAIHVEGRTDDILDFTNASGGRVSLLPLALATALEEHANVYGFQLAR